MDRFKYRGHDVFVSDGDLSRYTTDPKGRRCLNSALGLGIIAIGIGFGIYRLITFDKRHLVGNWSFAWRRLKRFVGIRR